MLYANTRSMVSTGVTNAVMQGQSNIATSYNQNYGGFSNFYEM